MINKIQELIEWTKDQQEKASKRMKYFDDREMYTEAACLYDRKHAFSEMEQKLTLLLDSENEKSSQSSHGDGSNSSNAM